MTAIRHIVPTWLKQLFGVQITLILASCLLFVLSNVKSDFSLLNLIVFLTVDTRARCANSIAQMTA
jgi:hypothetical protein